MLLKSVLMEEIERIYKQFIKHILPLPDTVADPAEQSISYLELFPSRLLFIKRALMLFGRFCRLREESIEK